MIQQRAKVLLIEDDPDSVYLMSLRFNEACGETLAFMMESAESLARGLELIAKAEHDLILLDLMLPDSEGLDTLKRARAAAGDTPIVVLTNLDDERLALEALAHGAQDFLTKGPIKPQELRRALGYALERSRLLARLRKLERLKAEIRERRKVERFKDQLLSTVSHELRSPLTVIKAAVANLWDGLAGPLTEQQSQLVSVAHRNAERLARMINNLLDLSRLESGQVEVKPAELDCEALMREAGDAARLSRGERKIEVAVVPGGPLPAVWSDADMAAQLLGNLLDNALRYARARVELSARVEEEEVVFTVSDDGPGIPRERLPELFNRFVQLDRPKGGAGYKGTGLGLAICHEIARLCRGRVWAESEAGAGARFSFTLPRRAAAPLSHGTSPNPRG